VSKLEGLLAEDSPTVSRSGGWVPSLSAFLLSEVEAVLFQAALERRDLLAKMGSCPGSN